MAQRRFSILTLSFSLAMILVGCELANRVTTTRIKDILDHPRTYEDKEVTIYGTVTGGVSLIFLKYFEIEDDSGSIKVVTDRVLPQRGEKLRVTGRMESIDLGLQRVIVIREKKPNAG